MSLTSQQYADLSSDSYSNRIPQDLPYVINGVSYKVLECVDNPRTGYQGTIYESVDTGEIVVAHRGTEFDRELVKDGLFADGGMVLVRNNLQVDDAIALTRRALGYAENNGLLYGQTPTVTVTGHSMGGTLAQVTAHHFDLKGEAFNPYGAASLNLRIPEGGDSVINHVMAGDVVSAASPHFGQVRIYATQKEIDTLDDKGYENNDSRWFDLRNPFGAAARGIDSHYMDNFQDVDSQGRPDRSVLGDPHSQKLAEQYEPMIDKYRDDVRYIRSGITTVVDVVTVRGVVNNVADTIRGDLRPGEPAELERQRQAAENEQPAFRLPGDSILSPAARNAAVSGLFDDLYVSMKSGDDRVFNQALANVAESDFNREFREKVMANVDVQERQSALEAQQRQQQSDARQAATPSRGAMMH